MAMSALPWAHLLVVVDVVVESGARRGVRPDTRRQACGLKGGLSHLEHRVIVLLSDGIRDRNSGLGALMRDLELPGGGNKSPHHAHVLLHGEGTVHLLGRPAVRTRAFVSR